VSATRGGADSREKGRLDRIRGKRVTQDGQVSGARLGTRSKKVNGLDPREEVALILPMVYLARGIVEKRKTTKGSTLLQRSRG